MNYESLNGKESDMNKEKYIKNPNHCPFCRSSNLVTGSVGVDNGHASQAVTCKHCGNEWNDIYTLTDVECKEADVKHTLGPWRMHRLHQMADGDFMASIIRYGVTPPRYVCDITQASSKGLTQAAVDVALMAAAPELLAALEEAVEQINYLEPERFDEEEHEVEFYSSLGMKRALIARAKGEV